MRILYSIATTLRQFDWLLLLSMLGLTCIGLSAIYSVDLSHGGVLTFFPTQVIALGIGLVLLCVAGSVHVTVYRSLGFPLYLVAILLLVGVVLFGVEIRGTTGWFRFFGFSFQPAEFAKVALILFLGWWIDKHRRQFDRWQYVFTTGVAACLLAGLILLQPDMGSALILLAVWFGLLIMSGTKKRYIALLLGILAAVAVIGWLFLFQDYQKERVLTFLDPARDPLGRGYNVTQSIIAVGSGKLFGRGLGFGSQSQLHFLPEAQTDFIIAVIAEELGFVGIVFVLFLYGLLLYRLVRIAQRSRNDFEAYMVVGIAILFLTHLFVNIGGAIGLIPVTGVPLPFLSYGGSSLIISFLLIGIAESVARSSGEVRYEEGD